MPSFSPTIIPNSTPAISVTLTGGVTYNQFKQSLGNYVYEVDQVYLYSQNLTQIQGAFLYSRYDSNGRQNAQSILSVLDPYQYATAIYIDTKDRSVVIDGRDTVQFVMQPNTTLQVKLFAERISNGDELDAKGSNNYKMLEKAEGYIGFFEQYRDFV